MAALERAGPAIALICLTVGAKAQSTSPGTFVRDSLAVDGLTRHFLVRVPRLEHRGPRPLVIMLHGHGGSGANLVGEGRQRAAPYRRWALIADREGLILAAPNGVISPDRRTGWNDCRADTDVLPSTDDVRFLDEIIAAIDRTAPVDRTRLFVVGSSNGGFMALRYAIDRPKAVRAAAAIVATMPIRSECSSTPPAVPVLFMLGTADPLVPYQGGTAGGSAGGRGSVFSAEESVTLWTTAHQIAADPEVDSFPDRDRRDQSRVIRFTWSKARRPSVVLYRIEGGGHTEPSLADRQSRVVTRLLGPQNGDVESAEQIWRFFAARLDRR